MRALVLDAEARTAKLKDIPSPQSTADELLVKVETISLNPVDPLYVAHPLGNTGRVVGSDFAGHAIEVEREYHQAPILRRTTVLQGFCKVHAVSTNDQAHLRNI